MKKVLHHMRNSPDHIKSRYVIVLAILGTAFIIGLWITVSQLTKTNEDSIQTESPFKVFGQIFSSSFSDVQTKIKVQKDSLSNSLPTNQSENQPTDAPSAADELNDESNPNSASDPVSTSISSDNQNTSSSANLDVTTQ